MSQMILFSELKAKELVVTRSSGLLFLFQWENKNVDLITIGSLIFGIHIKISSDLLYPTILILPHPTLFKHGTKDLEHNIFEIASTASIRINLFTVLFLKLSGGIGFSSAKLVMLSVD